MNIKFNNKIAALTLGLLTALSFGSCNVDQDPVTGKASISANSPSITITKDFSMVNGIERTAKYPFTLTLSEPQIVDIKIKVFQSGGTATEGEDFTIDTPEIIIKAYTTSAVGSFSIIEDTLPEGDETLSITVGDNTHANTTFTSETFNFTLQNYVGDALDVIFDWDNGDIFIPALGGAFPVCPNTDIDVYIADAAGFDINNPWGNLIGGAWGAATGDCPEDFTINMGPLDPANATFPDGEYVFFTDLWSNAFSGFANTGSLSVTTTFVRAGAFTQVVTQDPSQAFSGTTDAGSMNGYIAKVTIANGLYTITDFTGNDLVTGKQTNDKVYRPSFLPKQ